MINCTTPLRIQSSVEARQARERVGRCTLCRGSVPTGVDVIYTASGQSRLATQLRYAKTEAALSPYRDRQAALLI